MAKDDLSGADIKVYRNDTSVLTLLGILCLFTHIILVKVNIANIEVTLILQ